MEAFVLSQRLWSLLLELPALSPASSPIFGSYGRHGLFPVITRKDTTLLSTPRKSPLDILRVVLLLILIQLLSRNGGQIGHRPFVVIGFFGRTTSVTLFRWRDDSVTGRLTSNRNAEERKPELEGSDQSFVVEFSIHSSEIGSSKREFYPHFHCQRIDSKAWRSCAGSIPIPT